MGDGRDLPERGLFQHRGHRRAPSQDGITGAFAWCRGDQHLLGEGCRVQGDVKKEMILMLYVELVQSDSSFDVRYKRRGCKGAEETE